jgi:hypothetical protein
MCVCVYVCVITPHAQDNKTTVYLINEHVVSDVAGLATQVTNGALVRSWGHAVLWFFFLRFYHVLFTCVDLPPGHIHTQRHRYIHTHCHLRR